MHVLVLYLSMGIAALTAMTVHEFTKALVSTKLGDRLPKERGRLTLNPLKHFEFFGFFATRYTGLGWGKPVETSQMNYKDRRMGTLLTYLTPVVVNIIVGILFAFMSIPLWQALELSPVVPGHLLPPNIHRLLPGLEVSKIITFHFWSLLRWIAFYNVTFALFNIIPIYPLSGSKILGLFLNPNAALSMARYEKIFQIVLLMLIFLGFLSGIINPIANNLLRFTL